MTDDDNRMIEELTQREHDVLKLLVQAHSNREISEKLNVSVETIRTHTKRIYSKLNVSGRQEASFRAIQLGLVNDPTYTTTPTLTNLRTTYDTFIGRERELSDLSALFTNGGRFISIVGVGGMGKTRLAIEFAQQAYERYQHGIYIVKLESITDAESVILQIADSISLQLVGKESASQQILTYLQNKEMLLIIDNCEHLLNDLAFLTDMLQSSSHLHILATSRERLNLMQETVYALGGLSIPTENITVQEDQADAVQLLRRFAHRAQPDWQITDENRDAVYELCHLTQGMPLAIMLAASWIDVYSLSRIVEEVKQNVDFLAVDFRDMPDRHRSMRAVFDWTWQLLTDDERDVLMKFSVFSNGGLLDAVETITKATPHILKSLVSKALIHRDATGRYRMHPLQRQYSAEKLEILPTLTREIYNEHAKYYVMIAEDMMTNKLYGEQMKAELDNLYRTWHWLVDTQNMDLLWRGVNIYSIIAYQLGNVRETKALYVYAIEKLGAEQYPYLVGCLSYVCASLTNYISDHREVMTFLEQARHLLKDSPQNDIRIIYASYHGALTSRRFDRDNALKQLHSISDQLEMFDLTNDRMGQTILGYVYTHLTYMYADTFEDFTRAERYVQKAFDTIENLDHHYLIAFANQCACQIQIHYGKFERAQRYALVAEEAYARIAKSVDYSALNVYRGIVEKTLGNEEKARHYLHRALEVCREFDCRVGLIRVILTAIPWAIEQGYTEFGVSLLGFCMENAPYSRYKTTIQQFDEDLRLSVDETVYTQALQFGKMLLREDVIRDLTAWLED